MEWGEEVVNVAVEGAEAECFCAVMEEKRVYEGAMLVGVSYE